MRLARLRSAAMPQFKRVQTQFVAADPGMLNGKLAKGEGASQWGIWRARAEDAITESLVVKVSLVRKLWLLPRWTRAPVGCG